MKSIAISIDEPSLRALDALADGHVTRSQLIREAVSEYLARRRREEAEEREARILFENRELLASQLEALVADQADR